MCVNVMSHSFNGFHMMHSVTTKHVHQCVISKDSGSGSFELMSSTKQTNVQDHDMCNP